MKTIIFYALSLLAIATSFAQNENEVQTKSIKLENFISYIASQEILETDQKIYLALQIGNQGLQTEERFYLEQGIKLLSKRATENSKVAIGLYGAHGKIILPYTLVPKINDLSKTLNKVVLEASDQVVDGIDLAFQTATLELEEGVENTVILLRNNSLKNSTSTAIAGTKVDTAKTKEKEKATAVNHTKLGGALALTALTILPDVLEIIKN